MKNETDTKSSDLKSGNGTKLEAASTNVANLLVSSSSLGANPAPSPVTSTRPNNASPSSAETAALLGLLGRNSIQQLIQQQTNSQQSNLQQILLSQQLSLILQQCEQLQRQQAQPPTPAVPSLAAAGSLSNCPRTPALPDPKSTTNDAVMALIADRQRQALLHLLLQQNQSLNGALPSNKTPASSSVGSGPLSSATASSGAVLNDLLARLAAVEVERRVQEQQRQLAAASSLLANAASPLSTLAALQSVSNGSNSQNTREEDNDAVDIDNARFDTFPFKLYRVLADAEKDGNEGIISFCSQGRAFFILRPEEFTKKIMPKYFTTTRMASFQRQLNIYGFRRIKEGHNKGAYFHEFFIKGKKALCLKIKRHKSSEGLLSLDPLTNQLVAGQSYLRF